MHVSLIGKRVLDYIYKRKLNFILTVVVMIITIYMLFIVIEMAYKSNYYIYETRKTFATDDFININILMDERRNNYHENVADFIERLENEYSKDFGKFMYISGYYNEQVSNADYILSAETSRQGLGQDGQIKEEKILYIDDCLFDLCNIDLIEGEEKNNAMLDQNYIKGYVCRDRMQEYPIGTILENQNTMSKMIIAGYFDKGEKWVPDLLFHSQEAVVLLDDYIVSQMDKNYFNKNVLFYANVFNSIYIKKNGRSFNNIKHEIRKFADECGVKCYTYTLDELIKAERAENKELMVSIGILVMFAVIVAIIGIISANLSDVFSRHYDIAVMGVNGVAPLDIYIILFMENLIKAIISFCTAYILYVKGLEGVDNLIFHNMVVPTLILGIVIFIMVITGISYKTIKLDKLLTLMGGARL